jgi:hypothetical protein
MGRQDSVHRGSGQLLGLWITIKIVKCKEVATIIVTCLFSQNIYVIFNDLNDYHNNTYN